MIAITSISPNHANNDSQLKAVNSWFNCGMKVYSMNSKQECDILAPLYPLVTFIPTWRTMELTFGKPYPSINAIFDFCKDQEDEFICLINSDIELKTDIGTIARIQEQMKDGIVMANRVNHDGDYQGAQFTQGIDVFFIHKKYLSIYPQTIFCLGQCHFDYWIPYTATQNGIDITFIKQNIAYHLNHNAQYKYDQWLQTGRYFIWQTGLYSFDSTTGVPKMSTFVYNFIYSNAKRKEI